MKHPRISPMHRDPDRDARNATKKRHPTATGNPANLRPATPADDDRELAPVIDIKTRQVIA